MLLPLSLSISWGRKCARRDKKKREEGEASERSRDGGEGATAPPSPEIRAEEWKEMTREAKVGLEVISYK